jgi:microcompartment protein CcmL/EutN
VKESLGLLETHGLTPAMVALDRMEKTADVRLVQCEVNDLLGVVMKIVGPTAAVIAAIEAGRAAAEPMGGRPIAHVIHRPEDDAWEAIQSPPQFNPLIQQDVVFFPQYETAGATADEPSSARSPMKPEHPFALGFIETQGFTAVFEAIDTACKAGNVQVVGKEKLGGGYVCVIVQGELAAVTAAIEAGREKVGSLGKLIAAHVLARPSPSVLALLPKP